MILARSLYLALLSFVNVVTVLATDSSQSSGDRTDGRGQPYCKNLRQRHEWRALSDTQKADYIKAIRCLQSRPSKAPVFKEAKTRFDEFQAYHIQQADSVHLVGQFLPWHRHFVQQYENALRNECGYKGYSPYWDWTQDADSKDSIKSAPVFDPVTGFGGDGIPGTYMLPPNIPPDQLVFPDAFDGCIGDGPFANYTIKLGPGKQIGDHCLTRLIRNSLGVYLDSKAVANTTKSPTYEIFRVQLEGQPVTPTFKMHDAGHRGVGGEMSNFYSSPGDPLFYLHHANLDRIWWHWQQMVPSRIYEISGRSTVNPPYRNVTLDHPLEMSSAIGPTIPLWQIMDIHTEYNCYTYV